MSVDPGVHLRNNLLSRVGEAAGLAAGIAVTLALRLSPKWSQPLPSSDSGELFKRQARHQPVVGPRIQERAQKLPVGVVRDLVTGFAEGATAAPDTTFQLEAKLDRMLQGK